jgi:hypothetical protein
MRPLRPVTAAVVLCAVAALADAACSSSSPSPSPAAGADAAAEAALEDAAGAVDAGGGDDGATPEKTVDLTAASARVGATLCGFHARCFPGYLTKFFASEAECAARYAVAFRATHLDDARFAASQLDAMAACEAALSCDALYGGQWQIACKTPRPAAARKAGETCASDASCAGGACLAGASGGCGTCADAAVAKIGEACGTGAARCADGLTCTGSKKCVAVRGLGQSCDATQNLCGNGLVCKAGACVKLPGAGETCDDRGGCDPFRFAGCDGATTTCVAVTELALGEACTLGALSSCGAGACVSGGKDAGSTCTARKPAGEACQTSSECAIFGSCSGPTGAKQCVDPKTTCAH